MLVFSQSGQTTQPYNDDTKYSVAEILGSMANGEATNTTAATGFNSASDDILTPNTLHSIEQSLQMQQTMTSSEYTTTTVAPPVHIKQEFVSADDSSQDPDWVPGYQAKRPKMDNKIPLTVHMEESYAVSSSGRRTGPRPRKPIVELSPDEEAKLQQRRLRNKLAAAKCRQRRVDITNSLLTEVEGLEDEKSKHEETIRQLQQQKEQLEFVLQAHKPLCSATNKLSNKRPAPSNVSPRSAASSRPASLPIATTTVVTETGITLSTPSAGLLSFSNLTDGHTGLTPLVNSVPVTSAADLSTPDLLTL